jgi:hypothetical protein
MWALTINRVTLGGPLAFLVYLSDTHTVKSRASCKWVVCWSCRGVLASVGFAVIGVDWGWVDSQVPQVGAQQCELVTFQVADREMAPALAARIRAANTTFMSILPENWGITFGAPTFFNETSLRARRYQINWRWEAFDAVMSRYNGSS